MKTGEVTQKRPFLITRYEALVSTKHLSLQRYLPDYTGEINVIVHDGSPNVCSHCSDKNEFREGSIFVVYLAAVYR